MDLNSAIIEWGSVFEALPMMDESEQRSFLLFLLNQPVTDRTRVAYRAICRTLPFSIQENLRDSLHFLNLADSPDYTIIFSLSGGDLKSINRAHPLTNGSPIVAYLRFITEDRFYRTIVLITDQIPVREQPLVPEDTELIIQSRSLRLAPVINICLNKRYLIPFYVNNDWFDQIVRWTPEETLSLILARIRQLRTSTPRYWERIAKIKYFRMFFEHYRSFLLGGLIGDRQLEKEEEGKREKLKLVRELDQIFPELIPEEFKYIIRDPRIYRIATASPKVREYYLGGEINREELSLIEIRARLRLLADAEVEFNRKYRFNREPGCNITDTLMEPINNYHPYDIIYYYQGGQRFYFTRPEFQYLIDTQKNPWNNLTLPLSFIYEVESRIKTIKRYNLPIIKFNPGTS